MHYFDFILYLITVRQIKIHLTFCVGQLLKYAVFVSLQPESALTEWQSLRGKPKTQVGQSLNPLTAKN